MNEKVFHKPGKGQAVVRTKLKNLLTSNVRDVTFKANDKVELADVYNSQMQYTYEAGQDCYFMDLETFAHCPLALLQVEGLMLTCPLCVDAGSTRWRYRRGIGQSSSRRA